MVFYALHFFSFSFSIWGIMGAPFFLRARFLFFLLFAVSERLSYPHRSADADKFTSIKL
jgi:hypothetical protein